MVIAIVFTVWYPPYVHKQRAMQELADHPEFLKKA
jgi:hypothetical protein